MRIPLILLLIGLAFEASAAELKNIKSFDFECSNEKRLTLNTLAAHKVVFHGFMFGIFESLME